MSETSVFVADPSAQKKPAGLRLSVLVGVGAMLSLSYFIKVLPDNLAMACIVAGISLLSATFLVLARGYVTQSFRKRTLHVMAAFSEQDAFPCLIADANGVVLQANSHAETALQVSPGARLDACLRSVFANPAAVLLRLQSQTEIHGRTREDVVTIGRTIPVSVFEVGQGHFCWRFELDSPSRWDDADVAVVTVGRNGVVLHANRGAQHLLGQNPDTLSQVISGDLPEQGQTSRAELLANGSSVLLSGLHRAGTVQDILVLPTPAEDARPENTQFADLPVPVMQLSLDGTILQANRLACGLVGEIDADKTNLSDVMEGLGYPIHEWLARSAREGYVPHSEFLRLTRRDKEVFVQVTLNRVLNQGQVCLIAVLNDATELKTLEAQFVQGQKMQAVGQLAGGVAHDFNNLLTAITGHCDLLLLRHDQNDPNYGDLVQINQNANRAAALVSQLLAFSRKQTLQPEILDLRDTISDLIHLLNRLVGEKIRLTLSHDPVLKHVRADKRQLEQVFMNLVVNARDAMSEGGEVRIETDVVTLTAPLQRDRATVPTGEYVTVKVIDSGVGIPADKLQKVFEPFYTTKRTGEGTGLGLSTVYGIVKQTGGFIFVDSVQGSGTEFTVFLPVSAPPKPVILDETHLSEAQAGRQGEGVVLLVEDEAPVRAFATRALRLKGYTVLEADCGEEALRLLEDSAMHVDVFVTDVVMPGLDGPTWVRQALQVRPDVQVIFMSGYTEGAFGDQGPEIANSAFLPKPFSLTQLTEAVFRQLN